MAECNFRAKIHPTGQWGFVLLEIDPECPGETEEERKAGKHVVVKKVGEFLQQKKKQEEKHDKTYYVDCHMEIWYKKRTQKQWNLYAEMVQRLTNAQPGMSWTEIHRGIKWRWYPRVGAIGRRLPKESQQLTVVEMAHVIQGTVVECAEHTPAVDIRDIWTLWTTWRSEQDKDPLEGTYESVEDYLARNPVCEACGRGLANDAWGREGQMDHIVPVGEGGSDDDWNRLRLCTECHIMIKHDDGAVELCFRYSAVKATIMRAWQKSGKSDFATRLGRVRVHFQKEKQEELGIF